MTIVKKCSYCVMQQICLCSRHISTYSIKKSFAALKNIFVPLTCLTLLHFFD